jgi:hypothetical protein
MIKKVLVHSIAMGVVDDPDILVAEPIWQWQQTEAGKWAMSTSKESLIWYRNVDGPFSMGYRYNIFAFLDEKDYTYWWFKYHLL